MANKHLGLFGSSSSGEEEEDEGRNTPEDEPQAVITTSMKKVVICGSDEAQPSSAGAMKSGSKRLNGDSAGVSSKRAKKAKDDKIKKAKKRQYFPKRWSEEDELHMLRAVIEFKSKTGKTPSDDGDGFYESFKNVVSFETNKRQFIGKIRHLKKKYMKKVEKGVEPSSLNDKEQELFKLSESIWGLAEEMPLKSPDVKSKTSERIKTKKLDLLSSTNANEGEDDSRGRRDVESPPIGGVNIHSDWFQESYLVPVIERIGIDSVKQKWSLVPTETKKKLEEKLKSLHAKEVECKKSEEILKAMKFDCDCEKIDLLKEVCSVIITKPN